MTRASIPYRGEPEIRRPSTTQCPTTLPAGSSATSCSTSTWLPWRLAGLAEVIRVSGSWTLQRTGLGWPAGGLARHMAWIVFRRACVPETRLRNPAWAPGNTLIVSPGPMVSTANCSVRQGLEDVPAPLSDPVVDT